MQDQVLSRVQDLLEPGKCGDPSVGGRVNKAVITNGISLGSQRMKDRHASLHPKPWIDTLPPGLLHSAPKNPVCSLDYSVCGERQTEAVE